VTASKVHADAFYTISSMGEVMCHTLRSDIFEEIVVHKFDDSSAKEVELAVLSRNMREAYGRTIEISRNEREAGQLMAKNENQLIQLCSYAKAISSDSWKIAPATTGRADSSRTEMLQDFKADLDRYTYFLPPRQEYFTNMSQDIPSVLQLDYDLVVFRSKIIKLVQENDWSSILKLKE
jgi:hypothetical protein